MAYTDGFAVAVPRVNKEAYRAFALRTNQFCLDHGALRVVDNWGDDVPIGTQTDFRRAVAATDDEEVVFSWIEWPDKATRDAAFAKMEGDPILSIKMPFDSKRMIFGGFEVLHDMRGEQE